MKMLRDVLENRLGGRPVLRAVTHPHETRPTLPVVRFPRASGAPCDTADQV